MKKFIKIKNYYDSLKDYNDFRQLGWENEYSQFKRFEILVKNNNLINKSILDVGCGIGSLYKFLIEIKKIPLDYTGVDILDYMIEKAKTLHPNGNFIKIDIFNDLFLHKYDYIFASGIFNLNLGNNYDFLKNALLKFYSISKYGIIINLLSDSSTDKEDSYFYFNEQEVSKIIKSMELNIKYKIINNYLPNDLSIILCKENIKSKACNFKY